MIDSHCHLDFQDYAGDIDEVLGRSLQNLKYLINIGVDVPSSKKSLELAQKYPQIFAAVGLHPDQRSSVGDLDFLSISNLAQDKRVVAVGEIGLDYYHIENDEIKAKELQKKLFAKQLEIAVQHHLPVVIHNRLATKDTLEVLRSNSTFDGLKGVFHSSTETDLGLVKQVLDLGFNIGLTGIVTFKNANDLREVVKYLPIDRILLETDAPFLAPVPMRGQRNEPAFVKYTLEEVARIKGQNFETVESIVDKNTIELFLLNGI